jgi:hypothetical protein
MTGVYIRVQKCISRAEPSAPQKHTNAAQLSSAQLRASEIIRMQQGNKRTNVFNFRIPFAPSTVSIAIKWLEMKGSWGCSWYTFRFVSGGTDDFRIRSDGSILFFFNAIAAHEICVRCRNCMPVDGVPYMSFGEHYSYDSYALWWQEVSLH